MPLYIARICRYIDLNHPSSWKGITEKMLKVNFILLALMAASYRTSFADLAQEITETACLLQNNATLLSRFQLSVRQEYNSTKSSSKCTKILIHAVTQSMLPASCSSLRSNRVEFAKLRTGLRKMRWCNNIECDVVRTPLPPYARDSIVSQ